MRVEAPRQLNFGRLAVAEAPHALRAMAAIRDQGVPFSLPGAHRRVPVPRGASPIGDAVNRAIAGLDNGTVRGPARFTSGSVERVWLSTGPSFDHAMDPLVQAIRGARHEVRLQTFVLDWESPEADRLLKTLAAKQREVPGFRVYLMTSGWGHPEFSDLFKWPPMFLPGLVARDVLSRYGVSAQVAHYQMLPGRAVDHVKTLVVDGRTALVGGMNVQRQDRQDLWVQVGGRVVEAVARDYADAWRRAADHFAVGLAEPALKALPHAPRAPREARPAVPMVLLAKQAGGLGRGYANDADAGLLAAIGAARHRIRVESPNLNDPRAIGALVDAARRGVQVELLIPRLFNQVLSTLDGGNNDQFLTRVVARLDPATRARFDVRWYSPDGRQLTANHTKYVSVDGSWAYVGSQNLDQQSFRESRELGFGIDDAAQTRRLDAAIFEPNWASAVPADPARLPANPFDGVPLLGTLWAIMPWMRGLSPASP